MVRDPVERIISWYYYVRAPWYFVERKRAFPELELPDPEWLKKVRTGGGHGGMKVRTGGGLGGCSRAQAGSVSGTPCDPVPGVRSDMALGVGVERSVFGR